MSKRDPVREAVLRERKRVREIIANRAAWFDAQASEWQPAAAMGALAATCRGTATTVRILLGEVEQAWAAADSKKRGKA